MTATIDMFEARSITNAINRLKVPEPFVLNRIFGKPVYHSAEIIDFEIIARSGRMAQFVSREGPAKPINKAQQTVKSIRIPRTFETKIFTAIELQDIKSVGNIYTLSENDRAKLANQMILDEVQDLKDRVIRRREWMALQALSTGAITVTTDEISFTIDFGYVSAEQLPTLSATAKWNATTGNPLLTIRDWKKKIMQRTGLQADIMLLGGQAAEDFLGNTNVITALDTANYRVGTLELQNANTPGANFIGRFGGVDVYEINQQYSSSTLVPTDMLGTNLAVMVASGGQFATHIAPIYRINNGNLQAYNQEFYVEPITSNDKTMLEWKCEQKSLPGIQEPKAVISGTVHV